MDTSRQYWVHNGCCGWSYGTPSDPQLITVENAARIMAAAGLSPGEIALCCPAAQYAKAGDTLSELTGGNRFLCHGSLSNCVDVKPDKVARPLQIDWAAA